MATSSGPNRWLLALVVVLAPLLGWLKVERQRAHPPEWASKPEHTYEGYVSIDGHARRAAQARDVLRGDDDAAGRLAQELRADLHPTSLLVPFLVGALALLTDSIPIAFLLVNLLAYALSLWLIGRISARVLQEQGAGDVRAGVGWSLFVFAAHVDVCRDVLQLHLDFTVTCLGLAVVLEAIAFRSESKGARTAILGAGTQILGVFTKASFAPFLAALPLAAASTDFKPRRWAFATISIAVPILCLLAYSAALGSDTLLLRDAQHFQDSWKLTRGQLLSFAVEFGLAMQWLPLVAFRASAWKSPISRLVLALATLYLASLLAFGLPAVPRLYLPAIALLCAVSGLTSSKLVLRTGAWPVYSWALLNIVLAVVGMG